MITPSLRTPWHHGPSLIGHLEAAPIGAQGEATIFRMAVQGVVRPDESFRGYTGLIASGTVRPGDRLGVHPGGQVVTVERIVTFDGDLEEAVAASP